MLLKLLCPQSHSNPNCRNQHPKLPGGRTGDETTGSQDHEVLHNLRVYVKQAIKKYITLYSILQEENGPRSAETLIKQCWHSCPKTNDHRPSEGKVRLTGAESLTPSRPQPQLQPQPCQLCSQSRTQNQCSLCPSILPSELLRKAWIDLALHSKETRPERQIFKLTYSFTIY